MFNVYSNRFTETVVRLAIDLLISQIDDEGIHWLVKRRLSSYYDFQRTVTLNFKSPFAHTNTETSGLTYSTCSEREQPVKNNSNVNASSS